MSLRVELTDKNFSNFKAKEKDEALENIIKALICEFGSSAIMDYNKVHNRIVELAEKSKAKLTDKRIKLFRNYFATVDENAEPVKAKEGFESDKNLTDTEKVPLLYEGGITAFYENEVKPYVKDAWIDKKSIKVGYELSFTKYFYKPVVLREVKDIVSEISEIEKSTAGLWDMVFNATYEVEETGKR